MQIKLEEYGYVEPFGKMKVFINLSTIQKSI
jgi:hypothetical protein